MAEQFANDFATTLAAGIDATQTTITVASATGAPTAGFRIRIEDEYLLVVGMSGTTWTVTRAIEGSTGASHASGVAVTHVLTAGGLAAAIQSVLGVSQPLAVAVGTAAAASYTTPASGTDWADVDATEGKMKHTIVTGARRVEIGLAGSMAETTDTDTQIILDVWVDGVSLSGGSNPGTGEGVLQVRHPNFGHSTASFVVTTDVLAPGSHSFVLRWRTNVSGRRMQNASQWRFYVKELPDAVTSDEFGATLGVLVKRVAAQSLATNAALSFDTVERNTDALWSAAAPTRVTFPRADWYSFHGELWTSTATSADDTLPSVRLNGTTIIARGRTFLTTNGVTRYESADGIWYFEAGDYIELINASSETDSFIGHLAVASFSGHRESGAMVFDLLNSVKAAPDARDDEFDSSTLASKWTAVSGSAGTVDFLATTTRAVYDFTTRPGWMLTQVGPAGTEKVELVQAATLADGESMVVAVSPTIAFDGTPGIVSNERQTLMQLSQSAVDMATTPRLELFAVEADVDTYEFQSIATGATSSTVATVNNAIRGGIAFLRVSRTGLTYHTFYSVDGASWVGLGKQTYASALTHMWIADRCLGAAPAQVPITGWAWFRIGENTIDPWDPRRLQPVAQPGDDADPFIGPYNPYDSTDTSLPLTANTAYFQKFIPRATRTVSNVAFRVITQSGNLDFGIYDASMVRLGSTGSFACPAASGDNNQALTAPVTLVRGRTYYFANAASSATYRTTGIVKTGSVLLPVTSGVKLLATQASALPLPAIATPSWESGSLTPRASFLFW